MARNPDRHAAKRGGVRCRSADDQVGGLAQGDPKPPQRAIIASGSFRQIPVQEAGDFILVQAARDAGGVTFIARATEDLKPYQVADQQRLASGQLLQPRGGRAAEDGKPADCSTLVRGLIACLPTAHE